MPRESERDLYERLHAKYGQVETRPARRRREPEPEEDDDDSGVILLTGRRADSFLDRVFGGSGRDDDDQDDDDQDDDDQDDADPPSSARGHRYFGRK